jgi:AraC family transcriptional regulator
VGDTGNELMSVDGELSGASATAQLLHFHAKGPNDNIMQRRATYWLDQCLTPRPPNARACYRERWSARRFEPLGQVFLVPPGETIQARADGGSAQLSVICHLRPDALSQLLGGELSWTDRQLQACLDISHPHIQTLLLRLAQEIREPGFASAVLLELVAAQLAIELGRYCTRISERKGAGGGLAAWRLRRIDERLHASAASPSLSELATLCGLSVRQLTRGFQASRGCSIGDHISSMRLAHAKRLLAADLSITAIATALDFASASSFCSAFRRATLQTPRQFRESIQHKAA